jgi:signal transduction histidine kinase
MKKVALVFVLAVFVPSLVLAWLAVRSLRDQQFLLERQQSLLYQGVADAVAAKVQEALADYQHTFALKVTALLRDSDSRAVARAFDSRLYKDWPLAQVGFAVTMTGEILAPAPQGRPEARTFYADNGRFLANRESVEVYLSQKQVLNTGQVAGPPTQSSWFPQANLNLGSSRQPQTTTKVDAGNALSQQPSPLSLNAGSVRDRLQPAPQTDNAPAINAADQAYLSGRLGSNPKLELRDATSQQARQLLQNALTGTDRPQAGFQPDSALANNAPAQELATVQNSTPLNEDNAYLNRRPGSNSKLELRNVIPQRQSDLFQNNTAPRYRQQQMPRPAVPPRTNAPAQPSYQAGSEANARLDQQVQALQPTNASLKQAPGPAAPALTNAPGQPSFQARNEANVRPDQQSQLMQPPNAPFQQSAGAVQSFSAPEDNQQQVSRIAPSEAEFRQLIGDDNEGTLARFVDNKLSVLFWYRPPLNPDFVFGAQIALPRLARELQTVVQEVEPTLHEEICVALLDDTAKPVALSHPGFHAAWKRPFVATEIGEMLPHWEVAVYLLNPAKLPQSAHTLKLTLGLLIGVLLLAIGVGSWLIVADLNRQLTLARQKTDFVSNVSHELKTPLTSIRMFSELLAEGRVTDRAKQRSYLGIITAETARLTRLINNVLDFARIERGEKKYSFQKCDLVNVVRETADTYRPHLEANDFQFACQLPDSPVFVNGDRDALAQVVVNLLSNAEKYSDNRKEIALHVEVQTRPMNLAEPESRRRLPLSPSEGERAGVRGPSSPLGSVAQGALTGPSILSCVEVRVLDRGLGVPAGCSEKIFEQFYRAHDSLSNGIQGSGLGLTLARQIARAHGGDVVYEPRDGGGSCFTLRLPVMESESSTEGGVLKQ